MEKLINKLKPKSEFSKNVLILTIGTSIAQAIPIVISPILTRLYTPDDFGTFALFIAITSVLSTIANGRYELAIMLPKKNQDAINIFALGLIINILFSLILFVSIFIFFDKLIKLLDSMENPLWLYLIPLSVFLMGFFNLLNYFNNRLKNYKDLSKANIYKSIVMSLTQLILGFFKFGTLGLIGGQLLSFIVANGKLILNVKKLQLLSYIQLKKFLMLGKKFKDFPLFNTPSALADSLTLQIPYILLPKLYTTAVAGLFFLSSRIIFLPTGLISKNIAQVFLQEISYKHQHKQKITPILIRTFIKLFKISFIISIAFFLLSPYIFGVVFGNNWKEAGYIAQFLSLIFFIRFIVSPLSSIFVLKPFVKIGSYWQFSYLFITLALFFLCFILNVDFWAFLFLYIFVEYIAYGTYLLLIFYVANKHDNLLFR